MSARRGTICLAVVALASALSAGCYCHSGSNVMMAIGTRELPAGISCARVGMTDVGPAGFSSTYQRYQLDRRKLAREKNEQQAALKALTRDVQERQTATPSIEVPAK